MPCSNKCLPCFTAGSKGLEMKQISQHLFKHIWYWGRLSDGDSNCQTACNGQIKIFSSKSWNLWKICLYHMKDDTNVAHKSRSLQLNQQAKGWQTFHQGKVYPLKPIILCLQEFKYCLNDIRKSFHVTLSLFCLLTNLPFHKDCCAECACGKTSYM